MIELKSMAVAMPEVVGHPNRTEFHGVLTMVDVASERAPSGAKGHRVVLTKRAAEAALPSLLGMALDYSPSLDRHDVRRKVGVITRADIVGRNVELGGYLFARDFPEIVEEIAKAKHSGDRKPVNTSLKPPAAHAIHAGASYGRPERFMERRRLTTSLRAAAERVLGLAAAIRKSPEHMKQRAPAFDRTIRAETCLVAAGTAGLGLSYEVAEVVVADMREQIWILSKVTFTGAAILRRDKAAYRNTWIELST